MNKTPRLLSFFTEDDNLVEIKILLKNKIYVYSTTNCEKIRSIKRQDEAGHFGFKQLNVIKKIARLVETKIVDPE